MCVCVKKKRPAENNRLSSLKTMVLRLLRRLVLRLLRRLFSRLLRSLHIGLSYALTLLIINNGV